MQFCVACVPRRLVVHTSPLKRVVVMRPFMSHYSGRPRDYIWTILYASFAANRQLGRCEFQNMGPRHATIAWIRRRNAASHYQGLGRGFHGISHKTYSNLSVDYGAYQCAKISHCFKFIARRLSGPPPTAKVLLLLLADNRARAN